MHSFNGRKILITGGLGFIGSSLAPKLVGLGADETLVDSLTPQYGGNLANVEDLRDKAHVNIPDVREPHAMLYLIKGKEYPFNLADQTSHMDSMTDLFTDLEINSASQPSILEETSKHTPKVRIIYASARQNFGKRNNQKCLSSKSLEKEIHGRFGGVLQCS